MSHSLLVREKHIEQLFLPVGNSEEASCIAGIRIFLVDNLGILLKHLTQQAVIPTYPYNPIDTITLQQSYEYNLQDIHGQEKAKRALEIAAAGGHNVLMKGSPGSGKTLLARTLPSILPTLPF